MSSQVENIVTSKAYRDTHENIFAFSADFQLCENAWALLYSSLCRPS